MRKFEAAHEDWGTTYQERKARLEQADPSYRQGNARLNQLGELIYRIEQEIVKFGDPSFPAYAVGEPDPALASRQGQASVVRLRARLADNSQKNVAKGDHYVPAPAFVIYGHELIHVLQHRYGNRMVLDPLQYPQSHPKGRYHNTAEHETIRALKRHRTAEHMRFYENMLRREHGITARKYHTGKSRSELQELNLF